MLWTKAVLGTDVYHIIQWFLIYSILGWVVESIYMSICNRKLTNRGFVRGPICPIYGVGALTVYFLLRPVDHNLYLLYLMGCIIPTLLEYGTALLMLKILERSGGIIPRSLLTIKEFCVWKVPLPGVFIRWDCFFSFTKEWNG